MFFSRVRWKRVGIAIGIGTIAVCGAYANWQWRQGVCIRYHADGTEKMLYGEDCIVPSEAPTTGETI